MKTKAVISFAVTAKLICVFGFTYADRWLTYAVAQMYWVQHFIMILCDRSASEFLELNAGHSYPRPCPKLIKFLTCSAQLRLRLINVKMPTVVGILTFISRINYRLL